MHLKHFLTLILLVYLLSACNLPFQVETAPAAENEVTVYSLADAPDNSTQLPLATPIALSPAAGICARFEGPTVTITINPDIPNPRCAFIRAEQILEVVNNRGETLQVKIGRLEAELAPGQRNKFELPFGEYLAPGVHRINVQPCCGAELVLESGQ